jgi:hypothetical protein
MGSKVPGQQIGNAVDGVLGDAAQIPAATRRSEMLAATRWGTKRYLQMNRLAEVRLNKQPSSVPRKIKSAKES